jgi:cyanophycinase
MFAFRLRAFSSCSIHAAILCGWLVVAVGAADALRPAPAIDPQGIPGALVICGGGVLQEAVWERFVKLAGGKSCRLVLIPTAAADSEVADEAKLIESWSSRGLASVKVMHTRSREEADTDEFIAPLKEATAVWFGGGQQSRIADSYVGTSVERELLALLNRGGVIGGTSAGAAIQCKLMIAGGNPVARTAAGLDLLPDAVIDQHFSERNRRPRLLRVLSENPGRIGFGIDESTALIVHKRRLEVVGKNSVTICLAATSSRPLKEIKLSDNQFADLTALRRAARERAGISFPPVAMRPPEVPQGALLLGGGGSLSLDVVRRFVELAGGSDAPIVILPTAGEEPRDDAEERRFLERAGAKNLLVLSGKTREEVESAPSLTALRQAKGIWFGGGRQWRFVDAYEGTQAMELFHDVLRRGGILGGSSAGASIQAEYMVRGSPLGNQEMMAEGYERGFGFLPGTAIDQHFTQRKRLPDMQAVMATYPQLLGIGLDEGSAILVRGETAEVLGKNHAYFFPPKKTSSRALDSKQANSGTETGADQLPGPNPAPIPIQVPAGKKFNLSTCQLVP